MLRASRQLTILTEPVANTLGRFLQGPTEYMKAVWHFASAMPSGSHLQYGGHPAVTRSLVSGLTRLGVKHRYNPRHCNQVGDVVIVLSGLSALAQAVEWKRKGEIRQLVAGPNLVVQSTDFEAAITDPEIDLCIVPCDWVRVAYEEDAHTLRGRIRVWPCGVDETYWSCKERLEGARHALVYWKNAPQELCLGVERLLKALGWESIRIVYGCYSSGQYKEALMQSTFAVFLSQSESQGIALAEAWAMDVPTLVWNPRELTYNGRRYSTVSACPYLSDATGTEWVALDELEQLVKCLPLREARFEPRSWVLNNMTDTVAAVNLLHIVQEAYPGAGYRWG